MTILKARRNRLDTTGLVPQLIGYEGWRVEAMMSNGDKERFTVGMAKGVDLQHIKMKSRRSKEGTPVERELLVTITPLYKK